MYHYDSENVFARILRQEIPCQIFFETAHSLSFQDIRPQAPVHLLVLPKGAYVCFDHFMFSASFEEQIDFMKTTQDVIRKAGLAEMDQGKGYRLIMNSGPHAHQEIPHFHLHILGGAFLGPLLSLNEKSSF